MMIGGARRLLRSPSPSASPPDRIPNLRRPSTTLLLLALLPPLTTAALPPSLQADYATLLSIAASNPTFNRSWDKPNPCQWLSVLCNNSRVIHLNFLTDSVTGPIPKEIANLSALELLTIQSNVSDAIPRELASLSSLTHLDLSCNSLTGPIPKDLASLSLLTHLDLSYNSLSGSIPRELGSLTSLKYLHLTSNSLTGRIPASLCKIPSLSSLDLAGNYLRGALPEGFVQLYERGSVYIGDCFAFADSDRAFICPRSNEIGNPILWLSDECYYGLCMPPHGRRTVVILWSVWGAVAAVVATAVVLVSERCRRDQEKIKEEKSSGGKSNVKGSPKDDGDAAIGRIGVCKYLWGVLSLGFILVDVVTNFQTMKVLMGGWSVYVVAFLIVLQHIVSALMLHRNCTTALPRTDVKIIWDWRRCLIGYEGERTKVKREEDDNDESLLFFFQTWLFWPLRFVYVIRFDILSLLSLKLGFQLKLPLGWLDLRSYWASRELTDALLQALPQAIFLSVIAAVRANPMGSKMTLDTTQVVLSISSSLGSVICVLAMVLWEARMERRNVLGKLFQDFFAISPLVIAMSEVEEDHKSDFEGGGKSPLSLQAVRVAEVVEETQGL